MPWHRIASGMCDRNVNAADGVGSLKQEPRTNPPTRTGAWWTMVPTGTAKMEIPEKKQESVFASICSDTRD